LKIRKAAKIILTFINWEAGNEALILELGLIVEIEDVEIGGNYIGAENQMLEFLFDERFC